ncbi:MULTISPECIES: hypothetical protein [Wolbachia]|nr:hypothetical protein [Wolbachia endosymbiont (group B) of Pammene fasciana]
MCKYRSKSGVIPVLDTGMALLHHSRKEQAVTDGICYKIDI